MRHRPALTMGWYERVPESVKVGAPATVVGVLAWLTNWRAQRQKNRREDREDTRTASKDATSFALAGLEQMHEVSRGLIATMQSEITLARAAVAELRAERDTMERTHAAEIEGLTAKYRAEVVALETTHAAHIAEWVARYDALEARHDRLDASCERMAKRLRTYEPPDAPED
jgi:uncharacterized protein involved in exopolysaccharide biosynthesis